MPMHAIPAAFGANVALILLSLVWSATQHCAMQVAGPGVQVA
jgi:hypothetical protein